MTITLDAADRALLRLLQTDARRTMDELGLATGLSASTAQRRVQRLRELGVIAGEVALVEPKAVGQAMTMLVELELERDRPELLPALHSWIASSAHIQQAWYVTGRGDVTIVVSARSVEAFDDFMVGFMSANRNIRKFTTSVVLRTLKRSLAVVIDDDA